MRCRETLARSLGKGPDQIQPGTGPPLLDMSASAANFQRRSLVRNRLIASGLLGLMAALFVATALVPQSGFWILLVRATAEAALVGGLADWFAVTAIFRQPLGLPIPHTAIVPRNKDRIGEGLATSSSIIFFTAISSGRSFVRSTRRGSCRMAGVAGKCADGRLPPDPSDPVCDERRRRSRCAPICRRGHRSAAQRNRASAVARAGSQDTDRERFDESLSIASLELCRQFLDEREDQFYAAAEAQRRRWWIPKGRQPADRESDNRRGQGAPRQPAGTGHPAAARCC